MLAVFVASGRARPLFGGIGPCLQHRLLKIGAVVERRVMLKSFLERRAQRVGVFEVLVELRDLRPDILNERLRFARDFLPRGRMVRTVRVGPAPSRHGLVART